MIRLEKVFKQYNDGSRGISNVTLDFDNTGIVYIKGKSGSGKTTLLNIIAKLINSTSGTVISNRDQISYVSQESELISFLNVRDNIKLISDIDYQILDKLKITDLLNKNIEDISGGEAKRVEIAQHLSSGSNVILLDEPLKSLDDQNSITVMKVLKDISVNKLVIISEHNDKIVEPYADRIIELKNGEIVEDKYINKISNSKNSFSKSKKFDLMLFMTGIFKNNILRNVLYFILLSVLFSLMFISSTLIINKNELIAKELIKNNINRTYVYSFDDIEFESQLFTEVKKYYIDGESIKFNVDNNSSYLYYEDFNNELLFSKINNNTFASTDLIIGNKPINSNEVLLSEYFYNCLKYFDIISTSMENSIGETIEIGNQNFIIVGYLKQNLNNYEFLKESSMITSNREINLYNSFSSGISSKDTIYVSSEFENYLEYDGSEIVSMMYSSESYKDITKIKDKYITDDMFSDFINNYINVINIFKTLGIILFVLSLVIVILSVSDYISYLVNKYIKDYYRLFLLTNKKYYIFNNIFFYISSLNIVSCLVSLLIVYRLIYYINKLLKIVLEFDIKILYMNYSYLIISLILIFIYTLVISIVKSNKLVKSYYNKLN